MNRNRIAIHLIKYNILQKSAASYVRLYLHYLPNILMMILNKHRSKQTLRQCEKNDTLLVIHCVRKLITSFLIYIK